MIHQDRVSSLLREHGKDEFLHPAYHGQSIANIGPSIIKYFGAHTSKIPLIPDIHLAIPQDKRFVVVLLIDGLGFDHFSHYHGHTPLLNRFAQAGEVFPLTSVFPSTTSAAMTSVHTGLTPQEHGLPEWNVYFEEFDAIINTIPFRALGTHHHDSLLDRGGKPEMLYEGTTVYELLKTSGIPSYIFISQDYSDTVYSRQVQRGAIPVPIANLDDVASKLHHTMAQVKTGPALFFIYWSGVDGAAHTFGPNTPEHFDSVQTTCTSLEKALLSLPQSIREETVCLLSADHGHVSIHADEIINLNSYPELEEAYLVTRGGFKVLPTGSPHDIFLFIKPELIQSTQRFLQKTLGDKAHIVRTSDALSDGYFGTGIASEKFIRRVGNLIILPKPGFHIWYEYFPDAPFGHLGIHGGLSPDEMIVPFGILPLNLL